MITIIADDGNTGFGAMLQKELSSGGASVKYYDVTEMDIRPCYGCGGCTYKTFGQCVFRDDCDAILPDILRSHTVIFISPILFGSYTFKAKRMVDKFALAGSKYYHVKDGELVKSTRSGALRLVFIGIDPDENAQEQAAFIALTHETRLITSSQGQTYIVQPQSAQDAAARIGREVAHA